MLHWKVCLSLYAPQRGFCLWPLLNSIAPQRCHRADSNVSFIAMDTSQKHSHTTNIHVHPSHIFIWYMHIQNAFWLQGALMLAGGFCHPYSCDLGAVSLVAPIFLAPVAFLCSTICVGTLGSVWGIGWELPLLDPTRPGVGVLQLALCGKSYSSLVSCDWCVTSGVCGNSNYNSTQFNWDWSGAIGRWLQLDDHSFCYRDNHGRRN